MEHALFEVFKHPAPFRKSKWCVQFAGGIACYRTKGIATQVANSCKASERKAHKDGKRILVYPGLNDSGQLSK